MSGGNTGTGQFVTCPQHGLRELKPDEHSGRCPLCYQHNTTRSGKGRPLQRGALPLRYDHDSGYTITKSPRGLFTASDAAKLLAGIGGDPVKGAELLTMMRRPSGVSKERFGVAVRNNCKEPMLTADASSVRNGLGMTKQSERLTNKSLPKQKLYDNLRIKPFRMSTAKYGRNSAFWGERLWRVYTLKYARGYVVTTDIGDDSRVFPTYGELRAAIKRSGWEIIR